MDLLLVAESPRAAAFSFPSFVPRQSTIVATRRRNSEVESMAENVEGRATRALLAEVVRGEIV